MIEQIDIVADEIMDLLEKSEKLLPLANVATLINQPLDVFYMAMGWLIREHYVGVNEFAGNKYVFKVNRQTPLEIRLNGIKENLN